MSGLQSPEPLQLMLHIAAADAAALQIHQGSAALSLDVF